MISADFELPFKQVMPKLLHKSDHSKQLFVGGTVISLRFVQSLAGIGNNMFNSTLNLRQYCADTDIACICVKDELIIRVTRRICEDGSIG